MAFIAACGWCSFPDTECPSGRKYAPHVGDGLARTCVEPDQEGTGSGADTETRPGRTDDADTLEPTDGPADSATDSSMTSGPSEGDATAGMEGTGTPVDPMVFFDDFERPDDPVLGNGWVEKTPTAFQLVDGQVVFESSAGGYEDNLWYRDESLLDVVVCIDFQLLGSSPDNHPQVHARIQPEDIDEPGHVTSYILYIESSSLRLRRDIAGSSTKQWSEPLTASLQVGPWYRLCMTTLGTDPVELDGRMSIAVGGEWLLHTAVSGLDDTADRIEQPGATGSSGADAAQVENLVYDDFVRTML